MTFSGWVASVAGLVRDRDWPPALDCSGIGLHRRGGCPAPSATLAGTLFGYVGLYIALMIAYMKALRIMAMKPAKSLEQDSNPLGTPLVGTAA
jgi:cytochrome d ubiquinol oxidase subunit I